MPKLLLVPIHRLTLLLLTALALRLSVAAEPAPWPPERDLFDLPDGFAQQIIAERLTGATAMALLPDDRILICEQTGTLPLVKNGRLLNEPVLSLTVDSYWERGLIGITLDPRFAESGYLYLCYIAPEPYPHHHVSRFTLVGDRIDPASEKRLWQGDDQTKLGGTVPAGHQGGAIRFGKDGKLYIALGEQTAGMPSQRLDTFQGKLLRINPDGSIPEDNPFVQEAVGKYRAIYCRGLRNPFMIAVHPVSGRIFLNDVGGSRWEEINEAAPGANFGWPVKEGPMPAQDLTGEFVPPLYAYNETAKQSITGGAFYAPRQPTFPPVYRENYFFAEYMQGWIRALEPNTNPKRQRGIGVPQPLSFAAGLPGPVDLQVAADGSLYVLCRNAWVRDDKFQPNTGSLHRITYVDAKTGGAQFTQQPVEITVSPDETARFTVAAAGENLEYRWQRDGRWLRGSEGPELAIPLVQQRNDGATLRCVVRSHAGFIRSQPARLRVTKLHAPVSASQTAAGLQYELYAGRWPHLPEFGRATLIGEGVVQQIDPAVTAREHDFALSLRGLVKVEHQGTYTFRLTSSGAAKLYVAGDRVAMVGMTAGPREAEGVIGLKRGLHPLRIDFAHVAGTPKLSIEFSGPERPRGPIAATQLVHATVDLPDVHQPQPLSPTVFVPAGPEDLPPRLSETGIFRSLADLSVNSGVIAYDVNSPLWSDGAEKRRWLIVPPGGRIEWSAEDPWRFPAGTVFVKHFELQNPVWPSAKPRRLETRLLVVDRDGLGYGVTYKWRSDQTDADLLTNGLEEQVTAPSAGAGRLLTWSYPSRQQCLICHTQQAGFVLGVNTRQLNRLAVNDRGHSTGENQLSMLERLGLCADDHSLGDAVLLPRLASIADESQPLEKRVRSYLDSNCSQCHQPGGVRAEFDARYRTPLARQNLFDGKLVAADLGLKGANLIASGDPEHSMILLRMQRREDVFNMPPLATHVADQQAVDVFRQWISILPPRPRRNRE